MRNIRASQYVARNKKLKEAGFENYREFLKSDIWRGIKREWAKRKTWQTFWQLCYICGSGEKKMVLHHLNYKKVTKVMMSGLVPLCNECHQKVHDISSQNPQWSIKRITKRLKKKTARKVDNASRELPTSAI